MGEFAILTNRKRAVIALVHSVVFLLLATWQMVAASPARGIFGSASIPNGVRAVCGIYVAVTAVLLWLFAISRGWIEKAYFALCTVSAASGLLRTVVGDHGFPAGRFIRVVMLGCAVALVVIIVRTHSLVLERNSELEG